MQEKKLDSVLGEHVLASPQCAGPAVIPFGRPAQLICGTAAAGLRPDVANHESLRTIKLYDLTRKELSFQEIERINI